jgi:hypothetical protein
MSGATDSAQRSETLLSPELVLVSPELREFALGQLPDQAGRNGTGRPETAPSESYGDEAGADQRDGLLRALGLAVLRSTALAAAFIAVIGGAAGVITISGGPNAPELASERKRLDPRERQLRSLADEPTRPPLPKTQGIGRTVVHGAPSAERPRPPAAATSPSAPRRLTSYGRLVWNLDALVRDRFGSGPVCLSFSLNALSPAACAEPPHDRTLYRATFAASKSDFRLRRLKAAPLLRTRVVPLKAGTGYISCGQNRWLAAGANWVLLCEEARPPRKR